MIKHKTVLLCFYLSFGCITPIAMAEENTEHCEISATKQQTIVDSSRCLDAVIISIDRKLESWVNLHTLDLEEFALENNRRSVLNLFNSSQSNFISFRNKSCHWHYLTVFPVKGADLAAKQCHILLTQNRIDELKAVDGLKKK